MSKLLAIIPARGGDQGIFRKNLCLVGGRPLLEWTIGAALGSKYIDEVVVSTDSQFIADVAKDAGAEAPFLRPKELATSEAVSRDVILHALGQLGEFDSFIYLQPTSPLRTTRHIDESYEFFLKKKASSVVSVCEAAHSPLWCNTLPKDLSMDYFLCDGVKNKNRQELPIYYRLNGAIQLCTVEGFLKQKNFFFKKGTYAYIMREDESIDIDDELDIEIANILIIKEQEEHRWDCARRDEWNPKYRK